MRILVLSDCHGNRRALETVLDRHNDIKKVFYLGDGVEAVDEMKIFYPDKTFYIVSGNCDWNSAYPSYGEAVIEGVKIIYTHGHRHNAKYGTERLYETARNVGATLVLYGHTHAAKEEYRDDVYIINPGALSGPREGREGYAVVDISSAGIMPSLLDVYK